MSTSSYSLLDFAQDDVITMIGSKAKDLHDVSLGNRKLDLVANTTWRKKYNIFEEVKFYDGANIGATPNFQIP